MIRARHCIEDLPPADVAVRPPARREPGPARSAIAPGLCMKWARGEGIGLGDTAVLIIANPLEAAALRQGLAWVGARTRDIDASLDASGIAAALAGATVAIVDTNLAADYARALGHLDRLPPVWWNGAGADFASLDDALLDAADDIPA
jgi:hypothetical protein